MPVPRPKASSDDVIRELRLTAQEFDWERRDDETLAAARVAGAIRDSQTRTLQVVGITTYTLTDEVTDQAIGLAERKLASSLMLRQRLVILASRPEEAPPAELIDLDALQDEVIRLEREWAQILAPYAQSDQDRPGTGLAWGATGIDETKAGYRAI